jgi:hypothetical protein
LVVFVLWQINERILQGRHLRILFIECRQPVRQAYKLGVAAAAVLAASHAIANIVGGCACVCCSGDKLRRSSPNRHMASFALVLTWYAPVSNAHASGDGDSIRRTQDKH